MTCPRRYEQNKHATDRHSISVLEGYRQRCSEWYDSRPYPAWHGACGARKRGGACIKTCLQEMEALQKANAELAEKAQAVSSAVRAKQKGVPGSWWYFVLTHEGLLRAFILS